MNDSENKNSSTDKVKALAERIVDECKQQGFQIHDFKYLQELLDMALAERVYRLEIELF